MEKFICQKKGLGFLPFGDFSFLFRRRKRTEKQKRKPALRTYFANKDFCCYGRKWPGTRETWMLSVFFIALILLFNFLIFITGFVEMGEKKKNNYREDH